MHILAQEEYGLRCLLQVAMTAGDEPLTIHQISQAEGLSTEYTGKLMRALRQGKLVTSTRGASGGYRLARPAAEITPWDVIQALGGSFFPEGFCATHPGRLRDCIHSTGCSVRTLWGNVERAVRDVLQSVTLAELAQDRGAGAEWLAGRTADPWRGKEPAETSSS
jgi:Rrf2 family protein